MRRLKQEADQAAHQTQHERFGEEPKTVKSV
jgi:hypothetical protein